MGFAFNPFTGNFDQKGSGGGASYIDGEEAVYGDLSLDAGVAPLNSAWLVRSSSGIWPFNKPGGIYIRTATGGVSRDADYTYAGTMPDVFSDAVLTIYDEASTTRTGQFNLGSVTAGQNRVLTWPDGNGTIARTEDFAAPPAIGSTTRNTVAATTMSATGAITGAVAGTTNATSGCNGFQIPVPAAGGASAVGMYGAFTAGSQRAVIFGANTSGSTSTIADFSANGLVANSIQNTPIGGTTPSTGAFTTLSANNGTITASAPVLDLAQTWNNSGVAFTALRINVTNTASSGASLLIDATASNGTDYFRVARSGQVQVNRAAASVAAIAVLTGSISTENGTVAANFHSQLNSSGVALGSNRVIAWGSTTDAASTQDAILLRDAAGTLAQRNATNPQTFRLYNTYTSATNFERLNLRWASNELIIDAEAGSAGGTLRGIRIGSATSSLLGFYGVTPVDQPATVADPAGGGTVDAEARTAINAIIDRLQELGLIA